MKIIRYKPEDKASILAEALVVLLSGGVLVYPTETAYALGADFFSPHACQTIYTMKFRDKRKYLPVIVPDMKYASTLVRFSPESLVLASKYWPGPLTLVLPFIYHHEWPHHGDEYLALRVSAHPLAASLARAFGRPLVSTSANISDHDVCYSVEDFLAQLRNSQAKPELIIDAGTLRKVKPSTVVKVEEQGMKVLREGSIKVS